MSTLNTFSLIHSQSVRTQDIQLGEDTGILEPDTESIKEIALCSQVHCKNKELAIIFNSNNIIAELLTSMMTRSSGVVATSLALIIIALGLSIAAQPVRYVRPSDPSHQDCIGYQPCLTLDQYAEQAASYFTMGATFLFLAGNHGLEKTLSLTNIAGLTLKGMDNGSNINVVRRNGSFIICESVTKLHFEGLAFRSQSDSSTSIFVVLNSQEVTMLNMTFTGSGDLNKGRSRAVYLKNSTLAIVSCYFKGNTAFDGGALFMDIGSNVTLDGNIFRENKASQRGAAIFAYESTIILKETLGNYITHNSAQVSGGGIFCVSCRLYTVGKLETADTEEATMETQLVPHSIVFSNNQARSHGGGIYLYNSKVLFRATNILFANNSALSGGGLSSNLSIVVFGTRHLCFTGNTVSNSGGAIQARGGYLSIMEENDRSNLRGVFNQSDYINKNCTKDFASLTEKYAQKETLLARLSNITFSYNSANRGGAIHTERMKFNMTAKYTYFTSNTAQEAGGAIIDFKSFVSLGAVKADTYQYFSDNSAGAYGGAVYQQEGFLAINGYSRFTRNYAKLEGGAICKNRFLFFMSCRALFANNSAGRGGAITLLQSNTYIDGTIIEFVNNTAIGTGSNGGRSALGGAIFANNSQLILYNNRYGNQISFTGNFAKELGGAIAILFGPELTVLAANFTGNTAGDLGGGRYMLKKSKE